MGTYVTWILVILGWVLVHYLNTVRERRKEIADNVQAFVSRIYALEGAAIEFHSAAHFDALRARELVARVSRISSELFDPPFVVFGIAPELMSKVRRSVTYRNFEPSSFASQVPYSPIIASIGNSADELARSLNLKYHARYLEHWWQCFRI